MWSAARQWADDPRARGAAYVLAIVVFAGGVWVAWRRAGVALDKLDVLAAAAVALVGLPLQVLFGGLLLRALARPSERAPGLAVTCRVVGLGTLSSVLPVSSGTVVRGGALLVWGLRPGAAIRALAVDAFVWLAVALTVSGAALVGTGAPGRGYACLGLAVAVAAPTGVAAWTTWGARDALELALWRLAGVVMDVVRLWWCFAALAEPVTVVEAGALAAASPVASLFFFLPGGLGVRELVTAGLALAGGLAPSAAFLAASLNRLLGLLALGTFELLVAARTGAGLARGTDGPQNGERGRAD